MLHNGFLKIKEMVSKWFLSIIFMISIAMLLMVSVSFLKIAAEVIGLLLYICLFGWLSKTLLFSILKDSSKETSSVSA